MAKSLSADCANEVTVDSRKQKINRKPADRPDDDRYVGFDLVILFYFILEVGDQRNSKVVILLHLIACAHW